MRNTMGEAYKVLNESLLYRISSLDNEKDSLIVCDPKGENIENVNIQENNNVKFEVFNLE
ncbi:hypothetical protein JJB67_15570 [Clostridium perfringens]|uniref:hypothetical protein n=1 Tax=Clostridium perfringens TaxID=1502 RepID=UPI001ABA31F6|nr:hypothetical protein [Clostridium perfringens]MBO3323834.1 hypothetical protein [Clostridium perfringens]MBO3332853.1 hypothetical protein [Clostridium perfringens]MBO3399437.1 hypothetical protein [Clostridium perfringens]MBO3421188.1 hypothetical protein [Clostridium perfringens]